MKPDGRDYKTDPVLKRLVDLDHGALVLARCQGPHTEGSQIVDVHVEYDGGNQEPIPDVSASQAGADDTETVLALWADSAPLPTEEPQESTATPALRGHVENVVLRKPRYQEDDEMPRTIK